MKKIIIIFIIICLIFLAGCSSINISPHKVIFNTNGGTNIESIETNKIESSPYTIKENFLFDGWYLDNQFKNLVVFPYIVKNDITLYAKWIKIADNKKSNGGKIKFLDTNYSGSLTFYITPDQFDYDRLTELGYKGLKITIEYDVYYKKDYDIPFDIGYAGSPKYEIYIVNNQLLGFEEKNLLTTKKSQKCKYTYTLLFSNLKNLTYTLSFSTDNVQNVIYFENISICYYVVK